MSAVVRVDHVSVSGFIEFQQANAGAAVTPDGSGLITLDMSGPIAAVTITDGADVRGIRVTSEGTDWVPTDGVYVMVIRAESVGATIHLENAGVSDGYRLSAIGETQASFVIGPNWIQIWYDIATSRWVIPNWAGFQRPVGEVTLWAGGGVPAGWLACDGSLVSRTAYPELFAAIGTTYDAGDGSTTFGVPGPLDLPISLMGFMIYAGR